MSARRCQRACCPHNRSGRCGASGDGSATARLLVDFVAKIALSLRVLPGDVAARACLAALLGLQKALRGLALDSVIDHAERSMGARFGEKLAAFAEDSEEPSVTARYVEGMFD